MDQHEIKYSRSIINLQSTSSTESPVATYHGTSISHSIILSTTLPKSALHIPTGVYVLATRTVEPKSTMGPASRWLIDGHETAVPLGRAYIIISRQCNAVTMSSGSMGTPLTLVCKVRSVHRRNYQQAEVAFNPCIGDSSFCTES